MSQLSPIKEIGVNAILLLTIGIEYSFSISFAKATVEELDNVKAGMNLDISTYPTMQADELTEEQFADLRKKFGNQKLMGLDYSCGGHLTHGSPVTVSGKYFNVVPYGVSKETGSCAIF